MLINYKKLQGTVAKAIGGLGRRLNPVIIRRDGVTDYPVKGIFIEYASEQINGDTIRSTDQKLILDGSISLEIDKERDVVIDIKNGGAVLEIISAIPVCPGDDTIMWSLQTRR